MERLKELIDSRQYGLFRQEIEEYNVQDIAEFLESMKANERNKIFRILPKSIAADVFSYLDITLQQDMIGSMSDMEAADLIDNLYADDAADLLEEMPANVVKRILKQADKDTRKTINELLKYPEDSAGSIMTTEFIVLRPDMTAEMAIKRIRRTGVDKETIYT